MLLNGYSRKCHSLQCEIDEMMLKVADRQCVHEAKTAPEPESEPEPEPIYFNSGMSTLDVAIATLKEAFSVSRFFGPDPADVALSLARVTQAQCRNASREVKRTLEFYEQECEVNRFDGSREDSWHHYKMRMGHLRGAFSGNGVVRVADERVTAVAVAEMRRLGGNFQWEPAPEPAPEPETEPSKSLAVRIAALAATWDHGACKTDLVLALDKHKDHWSNDSKLREQYLRAQVEKILANWERISDDPKCNRKERNGLRRCGMAVQAVLHDSEGK